MQCEYCDNMNGQVIVELDDAAQRTGRETVVCADCYFGSVTFVFHWPEQKQFRRFQLHRREDVTGVSGTGIVAEGTLYSSGVVTLAWTGKHKTTGSYPDMQTVEEVHCHHGATQIVWLDKAK